MSVPTFDLSGRRALVTGGASGIGLVVARVFRELGATVAITDIAAEALAPAAASTGAKSVRAGDVTREADVDAIVDDAAQALGGLDTVFNSAGLADQITPTLEQSADRWQRVLDTNLRGTWLVCRAAGRIFIAQRRGAIVNVGSINGTGGFPKRTAYGASKAGVMLMTRALASEWASHNVRVNAVAPGYIRTPMVDALARDGKIDVARINGRTPMGRMGEPEEVAQAAAFLVSDWAGYVTGSVLYVDGGWSAYGAAGDVDTA